jgi:periplasmic mercuric ion binding protein
MKTILIILFSSVISLSAWGQPKVTKATIKVYGNCSMCKKRIEAALDHAGIKTAEWNTKTKDLMVVFNSKKISEKQIHELVAKVGHDTDKVKATEETYASLPFCCLYRDHEMDGNH